MSLWHSLPADSRNNHSPKQLCLISNVICETAAFSGFRQLGCSYENPTAGKCLETYRSTTARLNWQLVSVRRSCSTSLSLLARGVENPRDRQAGNTGGIARRCRYNGVRRKNRRKVSRTPMSDVMQIVDVSQCAQVTRERIRIFSADV